MDRISRIFKKKKAQKRVEKEQNGNNMETGKSSSWTEFMDRINRIFKEERGRTKRMRKSAMGTTKDRRGDHL